MKLTYTFVMQTVGNQVAAVAVGPGSEQFNGMIKLNETGAFIFEQLKEDITEEALVAALVERFERPAEELRGDLTPFLARLRDAHLLEG